MFKKIFSLAALLTLTAGYGFAQSWPEMDKPARAVGGGGQDAAVIAGAENYPFVAPVPGAKANALAWYDYLNKTRGVPAGNIILLRDGEVTAESISDAATQAAGLAGKNGTLWFVFIGHGAPDKDKNEGLLVGIDAQQTANSIKQRSLPVGDLVKSLLATKAAKVTVFVDACFSGRGAEGSPLLKGLQPLALVNIGFPQDSRLVVLTAAKGDQFAGPLAGGNRPAFSYLALGALRGWAGEGELTSGMIYQYIYQTLRATVRDRSQTPVLSGAESTVLVKSAGEQGPDIGAMAKAETPAQNGSFYFKVSALPQVPSATMPSLSAVSGLPRAQSPGEIGNAAGIDFGTVDVDALGAYDAVVQFEKSAAAPEEKASRWRALGKDVKIYADMSAKRAAQWDDYAAQFAFNAVLKNDKGDSLPEDKAAKWVELGGKYPKYNQTAQQRAQEWERYSKELAAAHEAREKRADIMDKDWRKLSKLLSYSVVSNTDKQKFAGTFIGAYGKKVEDNPYLPNLLAYLSQGTLTAKEIRIIKATPKRGGVVRIPAGEFYMGSPDGVGGAAEHPRHKVYVDAFMMDKYDVTTEKYADCVKSGKCTEPNTGGSCTWNVAGTENYPANCVDWNQADVYCKWKGGRLPTEAEWEKAARGGTDTKWSFGDDESQLGDYAWYSDNSGSSTHPVGQKKPNQYGLYDMSGNVWQWVADWYDENYYINSPERNPTGPSSGTYRVLCGGSWKDNVDNTRVGNRSWNAPDDRGNSYNDGFRCAADSR